MTANPNCKNGVIRKGTRVFLKICLVICLLVVVIGMTYLVQLEIELHRERKLNGDLQSFYQQEVADHGSTLEIDTAEEEQTEPSFANGMARLSAAALVNQMDPIPVVEDIPLVKRELQPNFVELYARNPDTVGWITTGCGVDYPILWRDNKYYLDHDFDGVHSNSGSIFLDKRDNPEMDNDCLLIYGHNMRSGIMFGNLDDYRKLKQYKEEPFIRIQSAWEPDERVYVYFSMFDASMNSDDASYIKITNFDFETPEEKLTYLQTLAKRSMFELPIDLSAEDQIVCLITCSYTQDNGRFLLFARELREDENEESIRELLNSKLP